MTLQAQLRCRDHSEPNNKRRADDDCLRGVKCDRAFKHAVNNEYETKVTGHDKTQYDGCYSGSANQTLWGKKPKYFVQLHYLVASL